MQTEHYNNLPQTRRHERIVALIKQRGFLTTEELVTIFQVTPQTIRRDLNELDRQGLLSRHHGGAGESISSTVNTTYSERQRTRNSEKIRIARSLACRIPDEASLFISIGTSTEAVARSLLDHNRLKIITNNLHVASILVQRDDYSVIMAGGEVRNRDGGIIGEATRDFIDQFRVDYAIIGISGIDLDGSLLDYDYQEVRVAQAMIANARHRFLAADHSKVGRNAMIRLGHVQDIDALFTDSPPPDPLLAVLSEYQTELVVC
ncbi:DeoR/GlpR family transcriptional regulator [Candidatus Sororendozoicomonas aggregata]|uniref:DeoR/GlpR family transcriptional regulator n=1 Tax=Candidatus Sororendozoicomonas aggregata TaxID=3073239 RepID=UPI003B75CBD5